MTNFLCHNAIARDRDGFSNFSNLQTPRTLEISNSSKFKKKKIKFELEHFEQCNQFNK